MAQIEHYTRVTKALYGGKQGFGDFAVLTDVDVVEEYCNRESHIWFVSTDGTARQAKVNGKVRRWKRDRSRIEIPLKYGLYEYGTFDASDVVQGKILKRLA